MIKLICITCPKGCHLTVDEKNGYSVTGNACPRGADYAVAELKHPVRMLTSTVKLEGGPIPRLPVKTDKPLPKDKLFEAMRVLDGVTTTCPVKVGQVLVSDICGTDVKIVATKSY